MISGILTGIFLVLFVGGAIWMWRPALDESMRVAASIPLLSESDTLQADSLAPNHDQDCSHE